MEMPTPCQCCGKIFDLNTGSGSVKFYPDTVICDSCGQMEAEEIELCEAFSIAAEWVSNNRYDLTDIIETIYQVSHFRRFSWTREINFKKIIHELNLVKSQLSSLEKEMGKISPFIDS